MKFSILKKNKIFQTHEIDVYTDDTIENIKYKLSLVLDSKNIKEYYFFYRRETVLNPYEVYKQLTENNKVLLDKKKFVTFCLNHNIRVDTDKPYYELDDVLELKLGGIQTVNEPIGIEKGIFVVNPYDNIFNYYENIPTASNTLLLDYPEVDIIYVCLAEHMYPYISKNSELKLEIEHVVNVYYPYLFEERILSPDQFKKEDYSQYNDYNETIDFHHVKYQEQPELHTEEKGITSLNFVLYTKQYFEFPIEIFFKLVQSTMKYPYIKLNPGKSHENIYRLYAPYSSLNGNKSPYFDKSKLNKYRALIKKPDMVSYVIENEKVQIILEINTKGHIYYTMNEIKFLSIDEIEAIINGSINPLIEKLIHFFDPSEKIFNKFTRLNHESIDIIDMAYKYIYPKKGKLEVSKFIKCFSPIFNLIDEKDIIKLRYKRVSNFNVTDSQQAYMIDLINLQTPR